jgi:hypothetical protein
MGDLAKAVGASFRDKEKFISGVGRHLLTQQESDRRSDCIHPSEASHKDWCIRSAYYRIAGYEPEPIPVSLAFKLVFETGHEAHHKWQKWAWEMGILRGLWECLFCDLKWEDVSPWQCPRCEMGRDLIRYREVPVENGEYLIAGNADGDVFWLDEWTYIEVKTIGTGTVRYEAPQLIEQHTYRHIDDNGKERTGVDWLALWNAIRRPFPAHLRQGSIYCFCGGRDKIRFIYDPKFITAHPKEFEIKFNPDVIVDILDECLKVKNALEAQRPPKRPMWAEPKCKTCKECPFQKACYDNQRHNSRTVRSTNSGQEGAGEKNLYLPKRPAGYDLPRLPTNLTDMDDASVMELLVKFTRYQDYMAGQLAQAEIDEHAAEHMLEVAKAKHLVEGWAGPSADRVAVSKAKALLDKDVEKCEEAFAVKKARRKLLNVMVETCARDAAVVSREITRQTGNAPVNRRVDRFTP